MRGKCTSEKKKQKSVDASSLLYLPTDVAAQEGSPGLMKLIKQLSWDHSTVSAESAVSFINCTYSNITSTVSSSLPRVNVSLSPTPSFLWGLRGRGGLLMLYATRCALSLRQTQSLFPLLLCSCGSSPGEEGRQQITSKHGGRDWSDACIVSVSAFLKEDRRFYAQRPLCGLGVDSLSTCQTRL